MTDIQKLEKFISSQHRNLWLESRKMKVYVRKSYRITQGSSTDCLDIASVEVAEQGCGTFTQYLKAAKVLAKDRGLKAIFVENVLTERFANFFVKNGWTDYNALNGLPSGLPKSFILML